MSGLYDHPTSAQPAAAEAAAPATPTAATTLYPKAEIVADKTATPEVQAERDADVGRALYATESLFKGTGLDQVKDLDHVAAAEVLRDLGADPSDARQLATLVQALPQATAADLESWVEETGRIDPADMQLARDYLKTDPRARSFIERHPDLAFHPETCKRVISLARAAAIKKGSK
jgi:hypothetical protein